MKVKYYFFFVFILFQFCYAQNEKLISGKVMNLNLPITGIDVVNYSTKKVAKTDSKGEFSIYANVGDVFIIIEKEYLDKKISLLQSDFERNNFQIYLEKKPIELEDVKITKSYLPHIHSNQAFSDELKLAKQQATPKVIGVYNGTIENGMDFNRMGSDLYKIVKKLFKNDSEPIKLPKPIGFKNFIETNIDADFYVKNLKLEQYEIPLFIEFCEKDSKSKDIVVNLNTLTVMDFLMVKNIEFKKMRTTKD